MKEKTRIRVTSITVCAFVLLSGAVAIVGCSSEKAEPGIEARAPIVADDDVIIDLGCPACEGDGCETYTGESGENRGLATADSTPMDTESLQGARIRFMNEPGGRPKTVADCCEHLKGKMTICGKLLVICAAFAQGCLTEGTVAHQVCKALVDGAKPVLIKKKVDELLCSACKEDNAQECVIEAGTDAKPDADPKTPTPTPKK